MKIFIDAGHNYKDYDTGAEGNGLREQDITFYIANTLKYKLESQGIEVKMSRNSLYDCLGYDMESSLQKRAELANQWNADLFISIHCNAFNKMAFGTEVYCESNSYEMKATGYQLAKKVQNRVVSLCSTFDRGVKPARYKVLTKTNMPAILIETAFIDNPDDANKLENKQELFARGIYEGVLEFMGLKETEKKVEVNTAEVPWYNDAQFFVVSTGISDGTRPGDTVTRAEAWAMIHRLALYIEKQL